MNIVQRIAKNMTVVVIARVASQVLSFFFIMYTARHLGPRSFGILCFALAFTRIFGVVIDFGFQLLMVREVARDNSLASKYLRNIGAMKMILAAFVFGGIALTINLLNCTQEAVKTVYLAGLFVAISAFSEIFCSIFRAFQQMEYDSLARVLNSLLMLLGIAVGIRLNFSVVGFALLYPIVAAIVLCCNIAILKWKFKDIFSQLCTGKIVELDWPFWKHTIKEALPFGLAVCFVTIFYWIDSVMLSLMKGNEAAGWYNAAYRIVFALLLIPDGLISAIYPVMSRLYKASQDSLTLAFEKSFKYLTILGIPMGVAVTILARKFILLIYGPEYTNSIIALQILIWSSVLIFMSQPFGNLFNCLNMVLNFILIPKYSLVGASLATVLTQITGSTLIFIWMSRVGHRVLNRDVAGVTTKVLIPNLFMGSFIVCLQNLSLLLLAPLAIVLYVAILCVIGGVTKDDYDLFRKLVERE